MSGIAYLAAPDGPRAQRVHAGTRPKGRRERRRWSPPAGRPFQRADQVHPRASRRAPPATRAVVDSQDAPRSTAGSRSAAWNFVVQAPTVVLPDPDPDEVTGRPSWPAAGQLVGPRPPAARWSTRQHRRPPSRRRGVRPKSLLFEGLSRGFLAKWPPRRRPPRAAQLPAALPSTRTDPQCGQQRFRS